MPKPMKNLAKFSRFKMTFSVFFLMTIYVFIWFINVESLNDRWVGFYTWIFEFPPMFYLMILCPIYFCACLVAALVTLFQSKSIVRKVR